MPQWVEDCIDRYMKEGMSLKEASQRCYGANANRKKSKKKKEKKK